MQYTIINTVQITIILPRRLLFILVVFLYSTSRRSSLFITYYDDDTINNPFLPIINHILLVVSRLVNEECIIFISSRCQRDIG